MTELPLARVCLSPPQQNSITTSFSTTRSTNTGGRGLRLERGWSGRVILAQEQLRKPATKKKHLVTQLTKFSYISFSNLSSSCQEQSFRLVFFYNETPAPYRIDLQCVLVDVCSARSYRLPWTTTEKNKSISNYHIYSSDIFLSYIPKCGSHRVWAADMRAERLGTTAQGTKILTYYYVYFD